MLRKSRTARHALREETSGRRRWTWRDRRAVALNAVAAGVIVAGLATGTTVMIHRSGPPDTGPAANAADLANRDLAAQRADRSKRTTGPTPSGTPTPALPTATVTSAPPPALPPVAVKPEWVSPMPGVELTSCFGIRWGVPHQGIDFAGDAGTPIHAVGAGTVLATGWIYDGYGISVVIDHGNSFGGADQGGKILSHYAHASRTLVEVGQKVTPGQTIAIEGATGDVTGPHLHFEIHQGTLWNQIDPAPWLRARGVQVGC